MTWSRLMTEGVCDRRSLLRAAGMLAGTAALPPALASGQRRPIDFSDPGAHLDAWMKIYSDLRGHRNVYSRFDGVIFAVLGHRAALQPLLGFEGFAVNRVVPMDDGTYRVFINEVAYYKDLASGRILDAWQNPWTGERVEVVHLHAGPLTNTMGKVRRFEQPDGSFVETPFLLPYFVQGDDVFVSIEFNDVRDNPLTPEEWPRESAGSKIRVAESMQFMSRRSELEDPAVYSVRPPTSWTLMRSWLPWMLMGQRPGHLLYQNIVQKVDGLDGIPAAIVSQTERRFPDFLEAPPDSSWGQFRTSYQTYREERKPAPLPPAAEGGR